jgi:hypothetical protein
VLAHKVGVHESILFEDSWIRRLLKTYTKVNQKQIEVSICKTIEENWGTISTLDKCPTNSTILKLLGCSEGNSKNCPKVSELLLQKRKESFPVTPRTTKQRVSEEIALSQLRELEINFKIESTKNNKFLTINRISEMLGVSPYYIGRHLILHKEVVNIINYVNEQIKIRRTQRISGDFVFQQVLDFLKKRKTVNPIITRKEISKEIGISGKRLHSFPQVKQLLVFALMRGTSYSFCTIRDLEGYHGNTE